MRRRIFVLCLLAVGLVAPLMLLQRDTGRLERPVDVAAALARSDGDFQAIDGPRPLRFPRDHGPHPDTRIEWWYFTGHLDAPDGRPFGFQFTIFRSALAAPSERSPQRPSAWAADQLYMGHFAVTDVAAGRFHAFERFQRGAAGLAGAEAEPFRVWVGPWSVAEARSAEAPGVPDPAATDFGPLRLVAAAAPPDDAPPSSGASPATLPVALELTLEPRKPAVLHGDGGYSTKGSTSGSGSMYVSFPRLAAKGLLRLGGETLPVTGSAWMDHEWASTALSEQHRGWDWFSIQLDDGRELMLFQLLLRDGGVDPRRSGTLVAADGTSRPLDLTDLEIEVTDRWSPEDGAARYPAGWILRLPEEDLELRLRPRVADQELRLSVRYWEGAVTVEGRSLGPDGGETLTGRGYVEMTGYTGEALRRR